MKRRVYRAGAVAGLIAFIALALFILTDTALRQAFFGAMASWPDGVRLVLAALGGYLIGAIPIGYLVVGALTESDLREQGSGRTGTGNAFRAGGFASGLLTVLGDMGKGLVAACFGALVLQNIWAPVLAGWAAVLGHNASIFLRMRGGAGTMTNVGAAVAFWPPTALFIAPIFALGMFWIRIASVASLLMNSAVVLIFLVRGLLGQSPWQWLIYAIGSFLMTTYALRPNIERLRKGTEPRTPPVRLRKSTQHG